MCSAVASRFPGLLGVLLLGFLGAISAPRAATVSAVEFYHAGFDHFFMTTSVSEMEKLDAGTIKGWSRTGQEFKVSDTPAPGQMPVCRFFSTSFGLKSSHFYTPLATECVTVKASPDWLFEADAFYVPVPNAVTGACAVGMVPVYRLYNEGLGGSPNHAFTPFRTTRQSLVAQGWTPEGAGPVGVTFCVPYYGDLGQTRLQQLSGGAWEFTFKLGPLLSARAAFGPAIASLDEELPYISMVIDPVDSGLAAWDPYAAKIIVLLAIDDATLLVLNFEFDGSDAMQGCAYVVTDLSASLGSCAPFAGRRL